MSPDDIARISTALARLHGKPLWWSGSALDIQMFGFGAERQTVIRYGRCKGQTTTVAEYALHVQCAWALVGENARNIGSQGRIHEAITLTTAGDGLDGDTFGTSGHDARVKRWLHHGPHDVISHAVDEHGGFTLHLASGHMLTIVVDAQDDTECWRMLAGDGERHLVVSGSGVDVSV